MAKALGRKWTESLLRSDSARDWWRGIVWQSREHYDGLNARGVGKPVPYNKHRAAEDNVRATLQPENVSVRLNPLQPEEGAAARASQVYTNWGLRASRFISTTNPFITHGRTDGIGLYKVEPGGHWQPRVRVTDDGNEAVPGNAGKSEKNRDAEQLRVLQEVFPSEFTGQRIPITNVIDPMDFLMDSNVATLDESAFFGHRAWIPKRHIEELQKFGYYKNIRLNYDASLPSTNERWERMIARQEARIASGSGRRSGQRKRRGRGITTDEELWEVWEIHDREKGRLLHILPGAEGALRNVEAEIPGIPYIAWRPSATPWSFWAIPDVFQYISAQHTLDTMLSHMVHHLSQFSKSVVFTSDEITEDTKTALAEAINGEFISVGDLDAIKPQVMGALHPDMLNMFNLLSQVIHEISGVSQMAVGVPTSGTNTATEVNAITQFQSVRMRRMSIDLNQSFVEVAQRYLQLLREFAPAEITVPVLGNDAIEFDESREAQFATINRDQLAADFDFEIKVGAGAEIQGEIRRKQLLDLWNLASTRPDIFNVPALAQEIVLAFEMKPATLLIQEQAGLGGEGDLGAADFLQQNANIAGARGGGPGRGPGQDNAAAGGPSAEEAPVADADQRRRTGNSNTAGLLADAFRGGAPRNGRG
jgi:hypothetical protein